MTLVADRFALIDEHRAIDLSNHEPVLFIVSSAGGPTDQMRWTTRCDLLHRLFHPSIAPLIDYGLLGETKRFEAWRCDERQHDELRDGKRAFDHAAWFFEACGLTPPDRDTASLGTLGGRAVVVPDEKAGYGAESSRPCREVADPFFGIYLFSRRATSAIAELFTDSAPRRPRVVALWGPPGSGVRTATADLARAARMNGFVPVSIPLIDQRLLDLLHERSLLLICRGSHIDGWQGLIERMLECPKPHVLLFAGRTEVPRVDGVLLAPASRQLLLQSVRPWGVEGRARRRIEEAARQSQGLPGRFTTLLWGTAVSESRPLRGGSIAAERSPAYGEKVPSQGHGSRAGSRPWPLPAELDALRRRLEQAVAETGRGRHAAGDRVLRQVVGSLARRGDWPQAIKGTLALASSLLARGQPRETQAVLNEARHYACASNQHEALIDVAILSASASTDLGRLEEGEAMLYASLSAARSKGDSGRAVSSALALVRCLFWRGAYEEAHRLLTTADAETADPTASIQMALAAARVAVGRRDVGAALAGASKALEAARQRDIPGILAYAGYVSAFAHLAVGDRAAVDRDVSVAIVASRAARLPLCALKARLVAVEAARRSGQRAPAAALLRRVNRLASSALPLTVRARVAMLNDLLGPLDSAEIVKRHIAATGLEALRLFAGPSQNDRSVLRVAVEDVVEILACCQQADEEEAVLSDMCARLRTRLGAAAVALFAKGVAIPLCTSGGRVEPALAERVVAVAQSISPHAHDERIEGGTPVRYGGEIVGAVVARWLLGSAPDAAWGAALLTMAATAAGPAVAAAIRHRTDRSRSTGTELLGTSAAVAEVHRAIERAAAAPFPVLIEGESGSGKELVARALHKMGPRRDRPFCTLNCAALPEDLVEAELFGHVRGAFSGAVADRPGVFEAAHMGTLFLDEVGELSARAQAKLLRTIQEGELRRVGENIARRIDVRVVAATNRDLRQEVSGGRFRLDLMYRLDVVRIPVPPLRDRREDIFVLAAHFWREATDRLGSRAMLASSTLAALAGYDWPGNVRELQNVLAALAVRCPKRGVVTPVALPPPLCPAASTGALRLDAARRTFEEGFVRAALVRTGGHRSRAALELGVTRQGLTKLMARLGIAD